MPVTLEAYALRRALMRMELAAARDAEGALRWLGWDGEGPLWLRRYDVQLYLWYQLPTKYLASLEDKLATAEAFGRLLELLGVPYAELCAAPRTLALLERWEREDRGARRELGRLLDASGLEPPDTALLAWGSVMGLEEAQAREDIATALEEALEAGEWELGAPGFERRRKAIVEAMLATDGRLDAIHAERLQRWRSREPIRERVADTIAQPAPDFGDVSGAVAPARWLVEHGADGLALTQTGALRRALVREAVERCPGWWDAELFGAPNQEAEIVPLQELHHLLRRMRLLRRDGRRLVSTARARAMAPAALLEACATAWLAGETFEAAHREVPPEERQALLDGFLASPEGTRWQGDEAAEDVVALAIVFGANCNHGGPLRWSPVVVELFMLDWLTRKVTREPGLFERVPDVLRDWVRYAGRRRGVPEEMLREAVGAVADFEREMLETVDDPERWLWVEAGSRAGWSDMAALAATVADPALAERLEHAIHGRGAFRRFRAVLDTEPAELTRYHQFAGERRRGRARRWLAEHGLQPVQRQP